MGSIVKRFERPQVREALYEFSPFPPPRKRKKTTKSNKTACLPAGGLTVSEMTAGPPFDTAVCAPSGAEGQAVRRGVAKRWEVSVAARTAACCDRRARVIVLNE